MSKTFYTNYKDAVHYEIIDPLGEFAVEHDIDAIAEEVIESGVDDRGNTVFFVRDLGAENSHQGFWDIVKKHAIM